MVTNLKLYEIWLQTWNYMRHGKKREIIRDMVKTWNYKRHGYKLEIIRDRIINLKL